VLSSATGVKAVFVYKLYYGILFRGGVHARVDDHAFLAVVEYDIGIFLVRVIYKGLNVCHVAKLRIFKVKGCKI
jgi:hypothetical protein